MSGRKRAPNGRKSATAKSEQVFVRHKVRQPGSRFCPPFNANFLPFNEFFLPFAVHRPILANSAEAER